MGSESADPTNVQRIVVTAEDLVAAVEANRTTDRDAVLRVTPPFSSRMRARLHVLLPDDDGNSEWLAVDPEQILSTDAPRYPRPAKTEDALRADPDVEYTVERHRRRHEQAIETWRSAVTDSVRETTTLNLPSGPHDVDVSVLG